MLNPGKYAYRFTGHAMSQAVPHYLVGLGIMIIGPNQTIAGFHTSAFMALKDFEAKVQPGHFVLDGKYGPREGGYSEHPDVEATIMFTQLETDQNGKPLQVLEGKFAIAPAGGDDGFWMISTHARHVGKKGTANELVSGEAIRIREPAAP